MEVPTSSNEVVAKPKEEPLEKRLGRIVGEQRVLREPVQLGKYFSEPADTDDLVAVQPGSTEEVQEVVTLNSYKEC